MRERWLAQLALALASVSGGVALARALFGPLRFEWLDTAISVRAGWRPLALGLISIAIAVWLERRASPRPDTAQTLAHAGLGGVLCAGAIGWVVFLSATCGGADSYGYVSAAHRILAGRLIQLEPMASLLPIADAITAATPLGYTPSITTAGASVPIYPLGLPALMAAAVAIGGREAAFVVAPLFGLVLACGVWLCATTLTRDRTIALAAAAMTTMHPLVFTYAIQPMSDLPAAALFMLAAVGCARRPLQTRSLVLGGIAAALALLVRPVLGPALALLALLVWQGHRDQRDEHKDGGQLASRLASYGVPLASGLALQLALQWHLYGHPLANGYADMGTLFAFDRIAANLTSHAYWAWHALGPAFIGAVIVGLASAPPPVRWLIAVTTAGVLAPYLLYRTFDHWETLRFLLPALALWTIPAALGMVTTVRRIVGPSGGSLLAALLVAAMAFSWVGWLRDTTVLAMPERETRFRLAGEMVARSTPPTAVILADLHSGSIRYYAERQTVNWARVPSGDMPKVLAALKRTGHHVFLLLDDAEELARFDSRHGSSLDWLPVAQRREVQLYEAR